MKKIVPIQKKWSPVSWKSLPIRQAPAWPIDSLNRVVEKLSSFPPLIPINEIDILKKQLKRVADNKSFILVAGDCAETFSDFNQSLIERKLQIIFKMSLILGYGIKKPIIKIARLAGQFAKPRSNQTETIGKICLPSYMGDAVNDKKFNLKSRAFDPQRLIKAYYHSATTLNVLRSLTDKSIHDIMGRWNNEKLKHRNISSLINDISKIEQAMHIMNTVNDNINHYRFSKDFFTAHEALLLDYEQALTKSSFDDKWYDTSSHLVWLGYRTSQPDFAHVEFLSGIENPIGIKIGPETNFDHINQILIKLNPKNEKGKIILIIRYGVDSINKFLPKFIKRMTQTNHSVLWMCDPMHGNTYKTKEGFKTRNFKDIKNELKYFFKILKQSNVQPAGVHFELTPENVTECVDDSYNIHQSNVHEKYETACDPRLNNNQSLDIAFSINEIYRRH